MTDAASQRKGQFGRDQVVKIINSVISKVENPDGLTRGTIYQELRQLQTVIEDMRRDMRMASPSDINSTHIPIATDELDAVVAATEEATGTIMDSCESIEELLQKPEFAKDDVAAAVTKIYEACSFQDITGQRIKKVISTLRVIDEKISRLVSIMDEGQNAASAASVTDTRIGDEALLNGPQMPDQAISQADIDKLLDELG